MNMEIIMEFFYKKASRRIRKQVEKSGKKHSEIYKNDSKIISKIINNHRMRINRFLITDAAISSSYFDRDENALIPTGLLHNLDFINEKEILWGTDEEIKHYLPELFKLLWDELPDKDSAYQIDKDFILWDYVPYAENSVYYKVLSNYEYNYSFLGLYGKSDVAVLVNQEKFKQEALEFLYLKCAKRFAKIFNNFSSETVSFKKIDKVFKEQFIETMFIDLIKHNIPEEKTSLGLRIKTIIETDLVQSADLIIKHSETGQIDEKKKKLINAASTYAFMLKEIQKDLIESLKSEQ